MRPIVTEQTNSVFKLPGGSDESDLPVMRTVSDHDLPVIVSTWQPDEEERAVLAAGGNVELVVWGTGQPPVYIGITPLQALVPDAPPEIP